MITSFLLLCALSAARADTGDTADIGDTADTGDTGDTAAYVDTGATAERTFVQDIGCGSGGAAGALVLLGLLGGRRRAAR